MAEPALEFEGLEVRYGAVPAVRDLSLKVEPGEVVGLIGPNGAGKSTTLLAAMGAVAPTRGDIRLFGRSIRGMAPEAIARAGMGLVPEGRHIFGGLSVEENLRLGLAGRRNRSGVEQDLTRIYQLFPAVAESLQRSAGALSGGQQQQLAIARALLARPDVLLLDEPSLGLAPTTVEAVFAALEEIRAQGVTILLVEQRAEVTIRAADRTYVLANGRIRLSLTAADAADTERLAAAYLS